MNLLPVPAAGLAGLCVPLHAVGHRLSDLLGGPPLRYPLFAQVMPPPRRSRPRLTRSR